MLQVTKSHFCGIYPIFFRCCSMGETQVLMTVSNFSGFFLGIISWKGVSWGDVCPMGGTGFDGFFKKITGWRGHPLCPFNMWNPAVLPKETENWNYWILVRKHQLNKSKRKVKVSSGFLVISKQQISMFLSTQLSEFFTISEE